MQADREKVLRLMKTARGQMDGIIRMVEEDRYCIDISTQLLATEAILNKVNTEILAAHLKSCVADAKTDEERNEKIEEMTALLAKLMK
ncbi:MAG: metal-sensing transcriptional repressor [Lachnospiraceae bacterium]|nr:metal-sensing transcriptional repressor [Lachnospiraceae bacterium]